MDTMTNEPNGRAQLYAKIAAVAGAIHRVEKDGYNPQLKYKYATPATIMSALKPLLAEHKLAIVPTVTAVDKADTGGKTSSGQVKVLTRVEMAYLILCGDTGESLAVPWVGEGEDWSDKGIAKAQTIATRTFLINLFQIPSGDEDTDPDRGASYEQPRQQQRPQRPTPPQARQQPAPQQQASQKPRNVSEAKERFFARYGEALGGTTWRHVEEFLGVQELEPNTVDAWVDAARRVGKHEQDLVDAVA